MADPIHPYASRGGVKLAAALAAFSLNVNDTRCADLGCSTGGFTDCLLQHGADHVYAVDTAYGELAWTLRNDPRVTVMERTNALHVAPPEEVFARGRQDGGVDLVTVDLGWTRQAKAIPAALRWLGVTTGATTGATTGVTTGALKDSQVSGEGRPPQARHVITLIKPHYETTRGTRGKAMRGRRRGVLEPEEAKAVFNRVLSELPALGVEVLDHLESPITGGKGGNVEYLALLRPV